MDSGKDKKQSIAIAYSVQRKNKKKKMSLGGAVEGEEHSGRSYDREPNMPMPKSDNMKPEGFMGDEWTDSDDNMVDAIMRRRKMAKGGPVESEMTLGTAIGYPGSPQPPIKKAHGGSVQQADEAAQDMVDHVMRKRKMMADGGIVDIQDSGEEMSAKPGPYDDDNADAVKKELYDDEQISEQPQDSMGHEIDKDDHDMVSAIRSRMRAKRSMR